MDTNRNKLPFRYFYSDEAVFEKNLRNSNENSSNNTNKDTAIEKDSNSKYTMNGFNSDNDTSGNFEIIRGTAMFYDSPYD